jgi:hypothetical protein
MNDLFLGSLNQQLAIFVNYFRCLLVYCLITYLDHLQELETNFLLCKKSEQKNDTLIFCVIILGNNNKFSLLL